MARIVSHLYHVIRLCSHFPRWPFLLNNPHDEIVPILFGTYNKSTATAAEAELSRSLQTAFANFAKDPMNPPPAPNWPAYEPGIVGVASVPTLAEIGYQGNMSFDEFIQAVQPMSKVSTRDFYSKLTCSSLNMSKDGPCIVWDVLLDHRP